MLRRSWSRWLLAFVLLLALPAVYFMACVLSEGFNKSPYGPTEVLQVYVAQFRVWFGASQTQGLLKSFGFAATIISIACGLFKTLQIFEANLPTLLKNYLKKYSQHIFRERDVMLEIVAATTDSAPAKAGLFARRSDRRRQRILNRYIDSIDTAQVNSRSDFAKLNDSYDVHTYALSSGAMLSH